MLRVVYWNNIPSPYIVDRFNALADRGNVRFEAWFTERCHADRSWVVDESSWRFAYRYMPRTCLFGRTMHWAWPVITTRPDMLVSGYAEPAWVVGWAIAKVLGIRTAFRVLKTFDTWVTRAWWKEVLKKFMFRRVDGVEVAGNDGRAYALGYGARASAIFACTHTVDLSRFPTTLRQGQPRAQLRRQLGLEGIVFLYVGRLITRKGVFYLADAFAKVRATVGSSATLLLVGDGHDEQALRARVSASGTGGVVFGGFVQREQLADYYAAADVFVFPTLGDPYGLVVDEAMAAELPIITTASAGEIRARVQDGVNGWVVDAADVEALARPMLTLAGDARLCVQMGQKSRSRVALHTPEQWARDFERMIVAMTGDKIKR